MKNQSNQEMIPIEAIITVADAETIYHTYQVSVIFRAGKLFFSTVGNDNDNQQLPLWH